MAYNVNRSLYIIIRGGVGIAGVTNDEFLMPVNSRPGD